jgi:alkyldihydroxyacetonephosphate synthase
MAAEMVHAGWGDPARRKGLPEGAASWLADRVGTGAPSTVASVAPLPASRLTEDDVAALGADTSSDARVRCAAGRSYQDLLSLRSGAFAVPDGVVASTDVGAVLRTCAERGIAVVPFGGGTSVVGGVSPLTGEHRAVIALDLTPLDTVEVSETDLTAVLGPGLRGPEAEARLNALGFTLGHFPQSYEHASIGGYAATRSAGQASTGYGRFDALVVGLTVETPAGPLVLGRGAATAAGPSVLQLFLGSEGVFGVITSVTVKVKRLPAVKRYDAYLVRSWEDGIDQLRRLEQGGVVPDVARLSDVDETTVNLRMGAPKAVRLIGRNRCLLVLGWEGTEASVKTRRKAARVKGLPLPGAGDSWEHGRYQGPYLRDDLMDGGFLVETLETSASWSSLTTVWAAVRQALEGALGDCVVMCHVSHLYPHGASLYFTVLAAASEDPAAQWQRAKDAACAALVATGATITHHHAVGTDHRPWMTDEIGPLGVSVLQAVKAAVDPSGILNPGKLLP